MLGGLLCLKQSKNLIRGDVTDIKQARKHDKKERARKKKKRKVNYIENRNKDLFFCHFKQTSQNKLTKQKPPNLPRKNKTKQTEKPINKNKRDEINIYKKKKKKKNQKKEKKMKFVSWMSSPPGWWIQIQTSLFFQQLKFFQCFFFSFRKGEREAYER